VPLRCSSIVVLPLDGGCAFGSVRYRMHDLPMFVHCCHCTRCQRETGSSFAHHAIIEFSRFSVPQGAPEFVLVPTDSGGKHWVARCPGCRTAMWNEHGTRRAVTRYIRVGTLDAPDALPPAMRQRPGLLRAWSDTRRQSPRERQRHKQAVRRQERRRNARSGGAEGRPE
jgi:hypothetical protein